MKDSILREVKLDTPTKIKASILQEDKLDNRTKWTYSIGAIGRDMAFVLVSMFLITYIQYTMKLTVAQFSVISVIVIGCLIWDAFNDLLMGILIENSKLKLGKFRPWILLGATLNATMIILLFTVRLEGWGFVAFFGIVYFLWGITYSMNDIAYWGMLPSLTSNSAERNTLATMMSTFSCIGQFAVAGAIPVLVAGNAIKTYRSVGILIAFCFVLFQLLTFLGVRERRGDSQQLKDKLSIKAMFQLFRRNDQLIVIGISSLIFNVGSGLLLAFGMNFFYFEFGYEAGGGLILIFTIMYGLGMITSQMAFPLLCKHFTRSRLLKFSTFAIIVGYAALMMFGYILPRNVVLLNLIGFVIFFGQGLFNMVILIMLNNTIEYDEFKYKERHDSIISSARSFTVKLAGAVNQGIIAIVLIVSGIYSISQNITNLEIESAVGSIKREEVLMKAEAFIKETSSLQTLILRIGMVAIPILAILTCYLVIKKRYKIDEATYDEMLKEIKERGNLQKEIC